MKRRILLSLLAVLVLSSAAQAGPFTDEMTKCLVRSTSPTDKELLVSWVFAAISAHPRLEGLSSITLGQGTQLNAATAELFTTLVTERCRQETAQALQYEGPSAFEASFNVLGQVAMQELMTHPDVAAYLAGLESYFSEEAFQQAFGAR